MNFTVDQVLHLVISVATAALTVGGFFMVVKDLKRAFWKHVEADAEKHEKIDAELKDHDRAITRVTAHLDITGAHSISKRDR